MRIFGDTKPVIAMVHLGASPGAPLYDAKAGLDGLVDAARRDLLAPPVYRNFYSIFREFYSRMRDLAMRLEG